jgi:hypothetical protein
MTNVEWGILRKMQASVTFVPGTSHKRFILGLTEHSQLSPGGRKCLAFIAHRYRRQWKASGEELEWIDHWNSFKWEAMTEHYTRNTETATGYCKKCGKQTVHRVDDGRLGPCLDEKHPVPLERAKIPKLNLPEQKGLFEK